VDEVVELLHRLLATLPGIESWIDDLHAHHRIESVPASELPFSRLARIFPADLLNATRVAWVRAVPFPPVSAYCLPEFQPMADMPMAGITFGDMYFVDVAHASEGIHLSLSVPVPGGLTVGRIIKTGGATVKSSDLVTVSTFRSTADAQIAKGVLDDAGIESMIRSDNAGGMYPAISGAELLVRSEDFERAGNALRRRHASR
jgi:hypothetical protein